MFVGILKEIKAEENRVCMTPAGVEVMIANDHSVLVEKDAGSGSGFEDAMYIKAGAEMADTPNEIYERSDMVMHVKEPQPSEYGLIREGQIVFTYLHLAADEQQTKGLIESKGVCIAYETIQKPDGSLPLLTPMSEVAGRMAIQQGAKYLEMAQGGHGVLLGGVPGVDPGNVIVIGGGIVGINAAKMACGLGAKVYILDMNLDRLRYLSDVMPANCFNLFSSPATLRELIQTADVVVGAVLIPGAKAPKLITRGNAQDHEAGFRFGRCRHRSRRLFSKPPRPPPTATPSMWSTVCGALLRGQHARRGAPHLHHGVDQRDPSLRRSDCQQRLGKSHEGKQ